MVHNIRQFKIYIIKALIIFNHNSYSNEKKINTSQSNEYNVIYTAFLLLKYNY